MNFALIVIVVNLAVGAETFGGVFPTLEACEVVKAAMPERVAIHNAGPSPVKAHFYAAECVALKIAPAGKTL